MLALAMFNASSRPGILRRPTSADRPDTFSTTLVRAWPWLVCALLLPLLSLAAPRDLQLPITFAIPVVFVARRHSFALACLLAVGMPLLRLIGVLMLDLTLSGWIAVANFGLRVVVLLLLAFLVNSLSVRQQRLAASMFAWSATLSPAPGPTATHDSRPGA